MNAKIWILTLLFETSLALELCEYWTLQNKLHEHPECVEVILPANEPPVEEVEHPAEPLPPKRAYRPARRQEIKVLVTGSCSSKEVWACKDCESTCNNQAPLCDRTQCMKGCVCRMGLVRDNRGQCVSQRDCRLHRKPTHFNKASSLTSPELAPSFNQAVISKLRSWLPMVNDVWKELTNRSLF
ncbi:unnamed protein product, partial [Mesorhabditis belari]|uniref:TIL domain-containing protein n=1 Tax=Mesorhabditis belari TaxID=2138241 RepID=A0AAF3FFS4_9BILA